MSDGTKAAGSSSRGAATSVADRRTVLITGCSSGIGAATARAFLDAGWCVYATSRDPDDIAALAEAGAHTAALDVTDGNEIDQVVARVADEAGRIDCLVNNAGYGQFGAVEDVSVGRLHDQFDVNVYGPHRLVRAVLPHMRERSSGTIVTVSSVLGRVSVPAAGPYCASKVAVEALHDALRAEVAPLGIGVVLVQPGPVDTAFSDRVGDEAGELDRTAAYHLWYRALDDASLAGGAGPGAVLPERVARSILDAASSVDPPARDPVGVAARLGLLARFLPDRWRDAAFRLVARSSTDGIRGLIGRGGSDAE